MAAAAAAAAGVVTAAATAGARLPAAAVRRRTTAAARQRHLSGGVLEAYWRRSTGLLEAVSRSAQHGCFGMAEPLHAPPYLTGRSRGGQWLAAPGLRWRATAAVITVGGPLRRVSNSHNRPGPRLLYCQYGFTVLYVGHVSIVACPRCLVESSFINLFI